MERRLSAIVAADVVGYSGMMGANEAGTLEALNAAVPRVRRIEFRIGVSLGDVMVEGDDIYGDGVNIAVRLERFSKPGGIAISQTVRDHVGNRLDLAFEDCGEQKLKNIEKPVSVYSISLGTTLAGTTTGAAMKREELQ